MLKSRTSSSHTSFTEAVRLESSIEVMQSKTFTHLASDIKWPEKLEIIDSNLFLAESNLCIESLCTQNAKLKNSCVFLHEYFPMFGYIFYSSSYSVSQTSHSAPSWSLCASQPILRSAKSAINGNLV